MKDEINILILSCGTRNKIIQYFKKELGEKGSVIATDSSDLAPALYEADKHYVVPRIDEEGYLDIILSICKENKVKAVMSLIDPELRLLSKHKNDFLQIGTLPIISDLDVIELCFNKYKMYNFCVENGFPTVKSYINKQEFLKDVEIGKMSYPVFVKPIEGSASINISKVYSKKELDLLFNRFDNLMIQEYMDGAEYGIDVYTDMLSLEPVSIFIKEKIKMRAGETDKSLSVKDDNLFELVEEFVKKLGVKGIIDVDVFKVDGKYYISEVNPRFGGGYPHAYECGVNIPKTIINNIFKITNDKSIGNYKTGIRAVKYNELKIINF